MSRARPKSKLRTQSERIPTEVRLGGRFDPISRLTLAADLSKVGDRSAELSLGAEWKVSGPLALRVGANDREIAAGVGVMAGDLGLDYAFGFPHASVVRDELGESHRLSFHQQYAGQPSACLKSPIRSSKSSMPIDSRISESAMPISARRCGPISQ